MSRRRVHSEMSLDGKAAGSPSATSLNVAAECWFRCPRKGPCKCGGHDTARRSSDFAEGASRQAFCPVFSIRNGL
jgi:hypothetical protein